MRLRLGLEALRPPGRQPAPSHVDDVTSEAAIGHGTNAPRFISARAASRKFQPGTWAK